MRNFGVAAFVCLLPLAASGDSPLMDYPCDKAAKQLETRSNAEVLKALGKKVKPICSCFERDCQRVSLRYDIPLERTPGLTVSVELDRFLVRDERVAPVNTTAELSAFVRRFAAHPLGAALLALGPSARCTISPSGSMLSGRCFNGPYHLELLEEEDRTGKKDTRTFSKMTLRLPLEAFKKEPELTLALTDPLVSQFLAGKTHVIAEFGPHAPRRLVLKSAPNLVGLDGTFASKEAVTVFFKTAGGWADPSTGMLSSCAGEREICP